MSIKIDILILQMYETYQKIQRVEIEGGLTWEDKCFRLPIVKVDSEMFSEFMGLGRRRRREIGGSGPFDDVDDDGFGDDFFDKELDDDNFEIKEFDASVEGYPDPYCGIVERE